MHANNAAKLQFSRRELLAPVAIKTHNLDFLKKYLMKSEEKLDKADFTQSRLRERENISPKNWSYDKDDVIFNLTCNYTKPTLATLRTTKAQDPRIGRTSLASSSKAKTSDPK